MQTAGYKIVGKMHDHAASQILTRFIIQHCFVEYK